MFPVQTTPVEFKNATITGHFGFVFEELKLGEGNHVIIVTPWFSKCFVFKLFSGKAVTRVKQDEACAIASS